MPRYLGQHFLNNPDIIDKIIQSSQIEPTDIILEIGPGEGILTKELCRSAQKVIAIELDEKLKANLDQEFQETTNLEIIYADILKINIPQLLKERGISKYKLVANIPYYITSKIIRLFLEISSPPAEMVLMIQKEVAQRIVAKPGQLSKLAVSVQYYANAEILFDVNRENFDPPPEVDSSVIKITPFKKISKVDEKKYFKFVRAGFCARRKTLINNLSNSLHLDKKEVEEKLASLQIAPQTRAQELSIADWERIANVF